MTAPQPPRPGPHDGPVGDAGRRAFAARILALRERRGLTQREAANLAGVAPSTWGSWEEARRLPRLSALPAIAAALRVSTATLARSLRSAETPRSGAAGIPRGPGPRRRVPSSDPHNAV